MTSLETPATHLSFSYIEEKDDLFFTLFPHRFDYIWAPHPDPHSRFGPEVLPTKPAIAWQTERRHPLSDRLLHQGSYLYGVRFGADTHYCMLDIDITSPYHPHQDSLALDRIKAALEPLGLVRGILCTSSDSGGLHLYYPFEQAQDSWQLAIATAALLENAGFKLKPGQLEIFPNPKPYQVDGLPSLFNAHRLPMQAGSYLLNASLERCWSNTSSFTQQWQQAQPQNPVEAATVKRIVKQAKRKHFRISGKANKFINDLNAEIELGWTGLGQTNRLLGRITLRSYIFHHVLAGDAAPLVGEALVNHIIATAQALPGYRQWCSHTHKIRQRAEDWARCVENSRYYPYGTPRGKYKPKTIAPLTENNARLPAPSPELTAAVEQQPSWNQRQAMGARERIRRAVADLLNRNQLPATTTARHRAILQYHIGSNTLYHHKDLWHPTETPDIQLATKQPQNPPRIGGEADCSGPTSASGIPLSLFIARGGNPLSGGALAQKISDQLPTIGSNRPGSRTLAPEANELRRLLASQTQRDRMQTYLTSGDPILRAEAIAWFQTYAHPGALEPTSAKPDLVAAAIAPLTPQLPHQDKIAPLIAPGSPENWSDLLVEIQVAKALRAGLGSGESQPWGTSDHEAEQAQLLALFGKRSQAQLTRPELEQWLAWLQTH